jgi:hypothetical protein
VSDKLVAAIFRRFPGSLPDRLVMMALAAHAKALEPWAPVWPSVARLAAMAGLSERRVQQSLKELRAAGWLTAAGSTTGGREHSTRYVIATARVEALPMRRPVDKSAGKGARHAPFDDQGCTGAQERVNENAENSAPGAPEVGVELGLEQGTSPAMELQKTELQKRIEALAQRQRIEGNRYARKAAQ